MISCLRLRLSVTFLQDRFHGEGADSRREWPPSPLRLFSALIAGRAGQERPLPEADVAALRWLETLGAPAPIIAPVARPDPAHVRSVPNNEADSKKRAPQEQRALKTCHSSWIVPPKDDPDAFPAVHYLWPIPAGEERAALLHFPALREIARSIVYLGRSIDRAIGDAALTRQIPDGLQWHPQATLRYESNESRVPIPGTFDDLERVYASSADRLRGGHYTPPARRRAFRSVLYIAAGPARPCAAFQLAGDYPRPEAASAAIVAGMLRHAAITAARKGAHEFPGGSRAYVAGHAGTDTRFSYLVIPSGGVITHVIVAEPYGGDGDHARWAQKTLDGRHLVGIDGQVRAVLKAVSLDDDKIAPFLDASRTWSSVSPVILPGWHQERQPKIARMLLRAVTYAGISADLVDDISASPLDGPPGYLRPMHLQGLPSTKLTVRFRVPLAGPISVGSGRHCGLGLLAPVEGKQARIGEHGSRQ